MKNTIAATHATAKKILTCPQSISLLYEILEVRCLDHIAARLIDARGLAQRRSAAKLLTKDEARRIAMNIAKPPWLVR